jgi:DNA-binding transcriptional LysR family regulator
VFPDVDVRQLQAVVVLAEELNFTRASQILGITQPALSKQITEIEAHYRVKLFVREKGRLVDLTDAGRVFVQEARKAVFYTERAFHLSRAVQEGCEDVLMIGYSHYADTTWISALLAVRLPLYPKLRVRTVTRSAMELVHSVIAGELDLAIVTAAPSDLQITAATIARAPLYVALPETHSAARKEHVALKDLGSDEWILLAKHAHPIIHDAVLRTAQCAGLSPKHSHDVMTAHQAVHLVAEHAGIAIFPRPAGLRIHEEGVVVKPLSDATLSFNTCLIARAEDPSRLASEFVRAFIRRIAPQRAPASQMKLPLSA